MDLITQLRQKALNREPLTLEEMRQVLSSIRRGYKAATLAKPPKATKAAAAKGKTSSMTAEDIDQLFD